jgi:2-keto-3-deoxy-L-rhamnonate aldolase RhmA
MKSNPVKAALKSGGIVIGSEISRLRSADVSRIYAAAEFDFVFIDMEHSSFNLETVADMIQTARASGIVPIVRVPQAEYAFVARALDAGAQGIIVPRVNTPQQVEQLVSWVRYPPAGIRGYACNTAQSDGVPTTAEEFVAAANQETLLVIQIERREAVANLEEMLSIDGVDVACLGFMDLTVDLGMPGQLDHPTAVRAVTKLIDAANDNGVAPGIIAGEMATITDWMSRGMRFVSYATDEILLQQAATGAARELRQVSAKCSNGRPLSKSQSPAENRR